MIETAHPTTVRLIYGVLHGRGIKYMEEKKCLLGIYLILGFLYRKHNLIFKINAKIVTVFTFQITTPGHGLAGSST